MPVVETLKRGKRRAREVLREAVKADPDEPTLHFLLADVYEKTGLKDLAAEEYSESDFLLKQRP
jgi:Tfp pilus assembly protein PilF